MAEHPSTSLDLNQPRTVAQILAAALRLYARFPLVLLVFAVAVVAPYELIVLAVTKTAPLAQQSTSVESTLILLLVAFALVEPLVSALYANALVAIDAHERALTAPAPGTATPGPSISRVALTGIRVLPVVAAAQIVAGIAIGIGFVLFIVPGVFLLLRFAVVAQVAAIERTDWPTALRRSGVLTRHNYLRILGLILCLNAISLLLTSIGIGIAGNGRSAVDVVVGIIVATLTHSFQALGYALLYFDLRARQAALV